ncbi:MAG: hypothetical protein IH593_00140, partial [Bacteroidales bacterium]|nr:hypothetical protein [Bacteroidales bacterium]
MEEIEWLLQARSNMEQPANLPATEYTPLNYSIIIYAKAAMSFNYLRAYLGDSLFDASMKEYYRKWSSQHPGPDDLRAAFETTSDKDLTWFFSDLLGTVKRLDYKIISEDNGQLLVKNKGELASPLIITGMNGDSVIFETWTDGFTGTRLISLPATYYTEIKIDPTHVMPELYRLNNNIRTSGIFRKYDPVRTQLLLSLIEDPDKRALIYIPMVNWNRENGFMAGVALHNGIIMPKPVEYLVMPFYGFKNSDLGGYGRIFFNIAPYDNLIRMATVTLEGSRFGAPGNQNYHTAKVGLTLFFRPVRMTNSLRHNIFANYIAASDLAQIMQAEKAKMNSYLQFGYLLNKTGIINPFRLSASVESGKVYRKTAVEFNYRLSYFGRSNGLDIRLFAGTMLRSASDAPFYSLAAGGRSGGEQYLYGGTYPDRFSVFPQTMWSRQMTLNEGGLVSPVNDSLG